MGESYELETFEPVLVAMEKAPEQDVLDSLSEATQRVSQTSTFISNDVFANKYERELARSVTDAAVGVEKALSNKDVRELFPAYEVLMETVEYLSAACFREAPAPQENPAGTPGQNSD
ncbi:MAG: hypothetical protein IID38_06580 [Planctomycetes bacterium]|nr:hypothetical protein [Planctomycetota bacterium]